MTETDQRISQLEDKRDFFLAKADKIQERIDRLINIQHLGHIKKDGVLEEND